MKASGYEEEKERTLKEHPVLFNGDMVRAIIDGRKTQTRRVVKPNPDILGHFKEWTAKRTDQWLRMCPYGIPGDRLWVRETFCEPINHGDLINEDLRAKVRGVEFATDMGIERFPLGGNFRPMLRDFRWRPSIHMPRWASRITLEITDVRVQRLQEISESDAIDEGAGATGPLHAEWDGDPDEYRKRFRELWDSINAKPGPYRFCSNPWVWAISFKVVKP